MAANPYGIEQVDIPGLIGMHQQLKHQRLADLYQQRKVEQEDRKFAMEERKAGVIAKLFGTETGAPNTSQDASASAPPALSAPATLPTDQEAGAILQGAASSKVISARDAARLKASLGPNGEAKYQEWLTSNGISEASDAPSSAPVPAELPHPAVRSDGIKLNPDALKQLFAIDPELAMKFQDFAGKADKAQLERVAQHGESKAKAAMYLLQFPEGPQRQQAFQQIAPELLQQGFTEQELGSAILTDQMLNKDKVFGLGLKDLVSQQNADRMYAASEANRAADNARADKAAERADRADARSAVRFKERDKDRAALAASGGIRTDLSDLDY